MFSFPWNQWTVLHRLSCVTLAWVHDKWSLFSGIHRQTVVYGLSLVISGSLRRRQRNEDKIMRTRCRKMQCATVAWGWIAKKCCHFFLWNVPRSWTSTPQAHWHDQGRPDLSACKSDGEAPARYICLLPWVVASNQKTHTDSVILDLRKMFVVLLAISPLLIIELLSSCILSRDTQSSTVHSKGGLLPLGYLHISETQHSNTWGSVSNASLRWISNLLTLCCVFMIVTARWQSHATMADRVCVWSGVCHCMLSPEGVV